MRPRPSPLLVPILALALALSGCGAGEGAPSSAADGSDTSAAPGDTAPDTAPDSAPDTVPDTAPDTAPDSAPDTAPDTAPDAAPDTGDDALADADVAPPLPDPAFVFEARESGVVWQDIPVLEEVPTFYRTTDALPDLDVRAILETDEGVYVGTTGGLFRWNPSTDRFEPDSMGVAAAAVVSIRATQSGERIVATESGVAVLPGGTAEPRWLPVPTGHVAAAVRSVTGIWVATDAGVGRFVADGDTWTWEMVHPGVAARDVVVRGETGPPWVATATGLLLLDGAETRTLTAASGHLPDDDVRALAVTGDGRVLAATASGLALLDGETATFVMPGRDPGQLPTDDAIALAVRDDVWAIGHGRGATVRAADGAHTDHYVSGRWLMGDRVQAVALGPDGRRWLGTAAGLTRIDLVPRTLADKAAWMEATLDEHFWRMDGFVAADASFDDVWAPTAVTLGDKDNDGLWTQMQVGAWALAYGATGDPAYCEKARRAIGTMLLQIDIPAVDFEAAGLGRGFVTRSLVRDDEGAVFDGKATQTNWHLVHWTDGHDYYWKDDTSSDETTGHFFGYPLYYDLCADEEEKVAIADRAGALAAYILAHDFRLLDLDGEQTSHGEWYPELLAIATDGIPACMQAGYPPDRCIAAASGHGWLNGTEILGHMLAAWHMTGDPRFWEAYERLLDEHRYAELVDFHDGILTVTSPAIANHSDHELAILAYFTLVRYEPDDERRARWTRSLLGAYDWERPERNPLWAFLVASSTTGPEADVEASARSLHEIPLDLRQWRVDNGHRLDARRLPNDRHGDPQFDRVFPYDEIRAVWWNGNLYGVADGGNAREWQSPMFYLLPYWGLRYFGAISAPQGTASP